MWCRNHGYNCFLLFKLAINIFKWELVIHNYIVATIESDIDFHTQEILFSKLNTLILIMLMR